MTQWCATVFCWLLIGLLVLADYAWWAVIIAVTFAGLVLAIVITGAVIGHVRRLRYARDTDQAVANVRELPGPDHPQASGVTSDEDTGVGEWTAAEWAFIRGETDEMPHG